MDDADRADMDAEKTLAEAIRASLRPTGPVPNGRCHFCDEIVIGTALWCDDDCKSLWEREQQIRGRQRR